jgi:CheY-like chemotaxis protein
VEDEAHSELQYLYAPVVVAGFDLHVAGDASQAVAELQTRKFDAVIVDIRIPPGHDRRWIDLYERAGADPAAAKLGIHLLRALLSGGRGDAGISLRTEEVPKWLKPQLCGVFSVEVGSDVDSDLKEHGLTVSRVKGPDLDIFALLDLIKEVLAHSQRYQ